MHPTVPLFAAVFYVWVYYAVARSAMRELRAVDPEYYAYLGPKPALDIRNSLAIGQMLLDNGVPKHFYPQGLARKIALARWMLYVGPFVLIGAALLFLRAA